MSWEKVLSLSLMGVQFAFEVASLILMFIANDYEQTSFLYNFNSTLNARPIMSIKATNGINLLLDKWKGTVQGSYYASTDTISRDICPKKKRNKQQTYCRNILSAKQIDITNWKGKKLYTSDIDVTYTYSSLFNNSAPSGKECNDGKKKCGLLDTMNNTMCIDKDKECPINFIIVSNSSVPPSEYKYNFSHISFSDGSYLHFTNEAIDHYIVYQFKISDKEVCLDTNEYSAGHRYLLTQRSSMRKSEPVQKIKRSRFVILLLCY